ncbi:MAG: tRNA (guanosine(37)-N1)-methyltransferase TrmD [Eubacteriales bacterium]
MNINVLTLFPDIIENYFSHSIGARAVKNGHVDINAVNIRDFSKDKHDKVDDTPFGGGAGMLMMPQPLFDCIKDVKKKQPNTKVVYMSPKGKVLDNKIAREMANMESVTFLCGHYEGVDQRVIEKLVDMELSIGDYVLTGGELAALVAIDAIMRFIPGVLGAEDVHMEESFEDDLLEYPQYTRPADYEGMKVPEVLTSGHHLNIKKWQRERQLEETFHKRPDLLEKAELSKEDVEFLEILKSNK